MTQPRRSWPIQVVLTIALALTLGIGLSGGSGEAEGSTTVVPAAAGASTSAASITPASPAVEHTLVIAGRTRTYRSFTPSDAPSGTASRWPLMVVLHGRGQSPQTVDAQTGFLGLVRQRRAVLVFPDGLGRSWNAGHGCCGAAGAAGTPDTAFVAAVVEESLRTLPVDPARVYLVGYSNGGKLAYTEACAHPRLFAAMATYGSVPLSPCPAAAPLPVLIAAGRLDTILPFGGAPAAHPPLPSAHTAVSWLLARNGCTGTPPTATTGPAELQHWTRCTTGADVESVEYPGLGHAWPGTSVVGSAAAAATLMWTFLAGHHS